MAGFEFFLFWIGWCLSGGSPGPATLSIVGTAISRGSASWGITAALGVSALMLANAWVFEVIRYIGAVYLLFLAFKVMKAAIEPGAASLEILTTRIAQ